MASCLVSKKKFDIEEAQANQLSKQKGELQKKLDDQTKANVDLDGVNKDLNARKTQLEKDTADCGSALRALQKRYDDLNSRSQSELAMTTGQKDKLAQELNAKQKLLADQEKSLNDLNAKLAEREKRVNELQDLLNKKDQALNDLKKRIEDALLGFGKNDLTVSIKDGKIYVSLSEQLLFKSGSTAVDAKGVDALNKLAKVLEKQTDFDIVVEGHTDNVPIKTAVMKDNWDLSVLRATSITRILTVDNSVDPKRVIPSGRSEYVPTASNDTKEGRALNRRTDIILSPNLDAVFKILNSKSTQ